MTDCACYIGVKKKVATVLSALDSWSNVGFDRVMFPDKVRGPRAQYFSQLMQVLCKAEVHYHLSGTSRYSILIKARLHYRRL